MSDKEVQVIRIKLLSVICFCIFFSCEEQVRESCNQNINGRGNISSIMPLGTISKSYMSDFLIDNNIDIGVVPENDVKVFSVVYETIDWDGIVRQASGAIYVPDIEENLSFPIYSGQHGTESKRTNVASIIPLRGFDSMFMASVGYIGSSPDLLGLGVSDDVVHPYVHKFVAEAVVDKIRAVKSFMCSEEIDSNGQLFIAGYSEGGYVAMATHKLIEEKYSEELKVTASAPMAGPYDMSYSSRRILSIDEYPQPGYISFTYMSYNSIEKLDRPASDLFKSPFAERIPGLMDGSKSIDEANSYLTTSIKGLFAEKFLNDFLGEGEVELKKKFEENSLLDWEPIGPIKLFHGTDDDEVNYNNSLIAFDKLKSGGANIELITIPGGSHSSSVFISYAQALDWFNTLKK